MKLTSAGSATILRCGLLLSERFPQTSPGKNDNLHLAAASSTVRDSGSIGLLLVAQGCPSLSSLIGDFCSSARNFALRRTFQPPQSGFLQIPPHNGHPCLWLTVPATESAVDFHHQVIAHAGRTQKGTVFSEKRCLGFYQMVPVTVRVAIPGLTV